MEKVQEKKIRFGFITKRPFWVNLVAVIVLAFLIVFLFLQMLSWITNHGKFLTVPKVTGMKTEEAVKMLKKNGFEVSIQDSTFTDTTARGIVLKQSPDPDATVKANRTVFLVVNRVVPPMLSMPKLKDQSLTFALDMLARNHLQLEDTVFTSGFRTGVVKDQLFNGNPIPENTPIQWGSKITLVVEKGLGDEQFPVPDLVGLTFASAKEVIAANQLELAAVTVYPAGSVITDTASAFVVKQHPARLNEDHVPILIRAGQVVDLVISQEMIELRTDSTIAVKKDKPKDEQH